MKTTETDLEKISNYLKSQVGWVELAKMRKAIPAKHTNNMKIEAMRHLGLLERDGENVKLTPDGREYAGGDATKRAEIMRKRLRADPLYLATLEWLHFNDKNTVTKTDLANYWHDNHASDLNGAKGDALTDSTVFFMRMVGISELGRFVPAGVGRETHLVMDETMLREFATGESPPVQDEDPREDHLEPPPSAPRATPSAVSVGTGLNVNVEIHIAADAKAATIEEIFKNMRKYLLDASPSTVDGG
jgi:hypothetical protein